MKSPSKTNLTKMNRLKISGSEPFSSNLNNSNELTDKESKKLIDEVAKLLSGDCDLVAHKAVEKQILAFSHRELSEGRNNYVEDEALIPSIQFAGTLNPKQWWRRLALPSFVAGGFVLTALAFQILWQPLLNNIPVQYDSDLNAKLEKQQKINQTQVELRISGTDRSHLIVAPSTTSLAREENRQHALMELDESMKRPNADLRSTDNKNTERPSIETKYVSKGFINAIESTDGIGDGIEIKANRLDNSHVYTGSELSKSEYPEKEVWIKQIAKLFKEDQTSQATKELEFFKKAYPDTPIDEQFKEYLL